MNGLRRSVLLVRASGGNLEPWPPPDVDAVPDAVILQIAEVGTAITPAIESLRTLGVDAILDAPGGAASAAAGAGVTSVLCRDESIESIRSVDGLLSTAERAHGLAAGTVAIDLLVGAPRSFLALDELAAASDRVAGLSVDAAALPEAFGVEGSAEVDQFAYPRGRLVLAAALRRIHAIGLFEPAGHHRVAAAGMDAARFSFALGLHGGLCRTWAEVRLCNQGFVPDEARAVRARRTIDALAEAGRQGLGAVSLDGRMIDLPFIKAAETTLELARQAAARAGMVRDLFNARG